MLEHLIKNFKAFKGSIDFRCGEEKNRTEEVQMLKEVKMREHRLKYKFNKSTIIELNKILRKEFPRVTPKPFSRGLMINFAYSDVCVSFSISKPLGLMRSLQNLK